MDMNITLLIYVVNDEIMITNFGDREKITIDN